MSPILVRPVREQFEHDRVIRVLQARYKRKYEVAINPGAEQNTSVTIGELDMFPDLILFGSERSRKVHATVEVETTESINTLEAMAEWGPFSHLRAAFFLYVPAHTIDTVRRLCNEHQITPSEIWTFHAAIDQVRFTMVQRSSDASRTMIGGPVRATRLVDPEAARTAEGTTARPAAATMSTSSRDVIREAAARSAEARAARPIETRPAQKPAAVTSAEVRKTAKPKQPATPIAVKKAPVRVAKPLKKAAAKKPPRPAVARPRPAKAKLVKKTSAKRSTTSKR